MRERMKHGEKNAAIVKNHPFCMSFVKSTHSYGIINERDSFSTIARTPLACQKNKYNFRMKNNHLSCFAFCPPFRSSFQFFGIAFFLTVMGYTRSSRNDSRSVKRRVMLLFVDAPRDPEKKRINDVSSVFHIANQIKLALLANGKFELMLFRMRENAFFGKRQCSS